MQSIFNDSQLKQEQVSPRTDKPQKAQTKEESTLVSEKYVNFVTLNVDIGVALGYAIFYILILGSDIHFLSLHKVSIIKIGTVSYMHCIVAIKSIILVIHSIFYVMMYKFKALRKRFYRHLFYWELFIIIVATHLCSIQEYNLDDNDDHDEAHEFSEKIEAILLEIYNVWALYLLLPLSFLKNDVRTRANKQQMRFSTILFIFLMIKLYPGYLIVSYSFETLLTASFISRIVIIDIIHSIVVYVIRSMLFQIQSLKEEQEHQQNSRINEVKKILQKMPEGILIMPDKQRQHCYMNQELTYVLNQMGIQNGSCCCPDYDATPQEHIPEDYNEEEAFSGLYKKIFKMYKQQDNQMIGASQNGLYDDYQMEQSVQAKRSIKTPNRSSQFEELFSLRDIINNSDWKDDEERFFEIIMTQIVNEHQDEEIRDTTEDQQIQEERVFVQIKRLNVEYLQQSAKMIVIRDISLIIEFEKEKNENKYQELLTATMSHEMLTPLNSIINLSMYLEQKLCYRFQREEQNNISDGIRVSSADKIELKQSIGFLNVIKSSANILQYLIKDMIDLMNLRLDKFNQQTVLFSPIDSCNEILEYYEFQARDKGLYLKRMINHEARTRIQKLAGDNQRYMQILLKIVQNSVKFTYQGGIDIILDFQPHFMIGSSNGSIKSPQNNFMRVKNNQKSGCLDCGNLVTIIKDTGIGIPKENVERLFKIFGNVNRGQHSSLITTQGIGLGLTICKQLVEKLGGQINLSSVPKIGTEVQFSLPAQCIQCFKQQQSEQITFSHQNRQNLVPYNILHGQPKKNFTHQNFVPFNNNFQGSFTSQNNFYQNTTNHILHQNSNSINRELTNLSQQNGYGNSQVEQNYKTLNRCLTFKTPMTPQAQRIQRRPFGGDISIATNLNGFNGIMHQMVEPVDVSSPQNQLKYRLQFGDSIKRDINHKKHQLDDGILSANQSEQQRRDQLLEQNSSQQNKSFPNRSNQMPMDSVKSKFANKNPNPPSDLIDSSYPRPSNEEYKSRCITDSHNNAVVATEFVTSSHMSIQDKVAEKSFAMKVLHENNQRINSIINNKSNYLQSEIKEKRVSPMDKSQDIRNLLESSNMSVNDEINQSEKPFLLNEEMNSGGHSPLRKFPFQQNGYIKINKFSINGLEPYTEKITNKNDLKLLNILNNDNQTINVNQIQFDDKGTESDKINRDDENNNSQDHEKVYSVVTLQANQNSSIRQDINKNNNQHLTLNYGGHYHNSSLLIKSEISGEQIDAQKLNKCGNQEESGILAQNKNQTGFFPVLQISNLNQNEKVISQQQMKSKIISHEEVELKIDLNNNLRPSSQQIGVDQNSKSSNKKYPEIMLSADQTPQFNQLFKEACPALIINSTERAIQRESRISQINKNKNNLIIHHDKQDVMNQRSLRDMLFQPHMMTQNTKGHEKSSKNDQYQAIATFSLNPQAATSFNQVKNQLNNLGQEQKQSNEFTTLQEEEEPILESRPNLTNQNLIQQFNIQDHKEERKYDQQSVESKDSEIKINLNEIQHALSNNQLSPHKNTNNISNNVNQTNNSNNYSQNLMKKDCSCESTVLIVDDNFFNLLPLELILRETFGIQTDKALNGQEAVMKFANYNLQKDCQCGIRYKLVLMDLNMPIMDGYKASTEILRMHNLHMEQQIKQNSIALKNAGSGESCLTVAHDAKDNSLFIVAVTAFVNEENIQHCFESGMSDVIHKPLSLEIMKQVLGKFYYQKDSTQLQSK